MAIIEIIDENHWRQLRSENIGSSDIAALFDLSPHLTRFELYHQKKNKQIIDFDNDRMFWGRSIEPAIAKGVERAKGWVLGKSTHYYTNDNVAGMGCTPDFIISPVDGEDGPGICEAKNVDGLIYRKEWLNDEPPMHIVLQLQQQLACTGYKWGVIAALVGGNDLKIFYYKAHPAAIKKIEEATKQFWGEVSAGVEPKACAEDYDTLKDMFDSGEDKEIDLTGDNHLPELCASLLAATETRLAAEKLEKSFKAEIIQKISGAGSARCNGFLIKFPEIVKQMKAKEAHEQRYRQLTIKQLGD